MVSLYFRLIIYETLATKHIKILRSHTWDKRHNNIFALIVRVITHSEMEKYHYYKL